MGPPSLQHAHVHHKKYRGHYLTQKIIFNLCYFLSKCCIQITYILLIMAVRWFHLLKFLQCMTVNQNILNVIRISTITVVNDFSLSQILSKKIQIPKAYNTLYIRLSFHFIILYAQIPVDSIYNALTLFQSVYNK